MFIDKQTARNAVKSLVTNNSRIVWNLNFIPLMNLLINDKSSTNFASSL